jgi:carboxymethylenebutenolidase
MKQEWKVEATALGGTRVNVRTADGIMDTYVFQPAGGGKWPAVIFYMDGPGIRRSLFEMASRLASNGFCVVLPNLFYRAGDYAAFNPTTVFADPAERERLMGLIRSASAANVTGDSRAIMEYLASRENVDAQRVGTVGYCMGGSMALRAAATFSSNVKAAASFHGARLANEQSESPAESPHLLAKQFKARLYIGVAGIDRGFTPEEKDRLQKALEEGGARFAIEVYDGAAHGFAVPDMPVYNKEASERHWDRLLALFDAELKGGK